MILLAQCKIRLEDARFVGLYEDYMYMVGHGDKVTYVVAKLAERYHVGQRKVYQLIRRMGKDCTVCAVNPSPQSLTA